MANNLGTWHVLTSMNKKEAAATLGVSVRTVERLAAEGRLTKRQRRVKTRPAIDFDESEIEALKGTIGKTDEVPVERTPLIDTIGFRLDPHYVRRLTSAGARDGLSPGEYARTLVIRSLEDETSEQRFASELRSLREALADTFYAFLTMKCGVAAEEADTFVKETILRGA